MNDADSMTTADPIRAALEKARDALNALFIKPDGLDCTVAQQVITEIDAALSLEPPPVGQPVLRITQSMHIEWLVSHEEALRYLGATLYAAGHAESTGQITQEKERA